LRNTQRVLSTLALDELPDLAAEARHHVEQLRVRLADVPAQEVDHAEHLTAEQDRKGKGGVQSGVRGDALRTKSPRGHPECMRARATRPGPAAAWLERALGLRSRIVRIEECLAPHLRASQDAGLTVDAPERTPDPSRHSHAASRTSGMASSTVAASARI
jgi:hypothetical protein